MQRSLKRHQDGTALTQIVSLSSLSDYTGGGTAFYTSLYARRCVATHKPDAGSAVAFDSRVWHSGLKITRGTRYIVVQFYRQSPPASKTSA